MLYYIFYLSTALLVSLCDFRIRRHHLETFVIFFHTLKKKKKWLYSTNSKACSISALVICSALHIFTSDDVEAKYKVLFDVDNVPWSLIFSYYLYNHPILHDFFNLWYSSPIYMKWFFATFAVDNFFIRSDRRYPVKSVFPWNMIQYFQTHFTL